MLHYSETEPLPELPKTHAWHWVAFVILAGVVWVVMSRGWVVQGLVEWMG